MTHWFVVKRNIVCVFAVLSPLGGPHDLFFVQANEVTNKYCLGSFREEAVRRIAGNQ